LDNKNRVSYGCSRFSKILIFSNNNLGYTLKKLANLRKKTIITVTLNPVLDKTLWVEDFRAGKTLQVDRSETTAGGKGVNASRALLNFGSKSIATGILARDGSEAYLHLLNREHIQHDFLIAEGNLRTNVTIVSENEEAETHLREKGPEISPEIMTEFELRIKGMGDGKTIFVFAGSLPAGMPEGTYAALISTVERRGGQACLDASGKPLKKGVMAKPFFIKPNLDEVKDALGYVPGSKDEFVRAVHEFFALGIKNVMISLGKDGIIFSQGDDVIHARLRIPGVVNTVGSGDAALAGGIIGILSGFSTSDTARLACAAGGANTLVSGACKFQEKDVFKLHDNVRLTTLHSHSGTGGR
jgi:1-phosphofructokinase family hexose kinase